MLQNFNLIKSGLIDFNALILENYSFIGLNEVELVTLIKLQASIKKENNIDINALPESMHETMQLSVEEINTCLAKLIENKYIDILEENGKVVYSLEPTYKRLANVIDDRESKNEEKAQINDLKKTVALIEKEFNTLINPIDLELIKAWINVDQYSFYEINEAVLDSVKRKRKSVKVVNEILKSKKMKAEIKDKNNNQESDLKTLFNNVYGKINQK